MRRVNWKWQLGGVLAGLLAIAELGAAEAVESDYYRIQNIRIPDGVVLEVGATQVLDDQRLAVSTRLGDIYLIDGAFSEQKGAARFTHFASGLHEVLGLAARDGWLYCTQRCEVTRMKDLDGDGRADLFETVSDDWGITGDYHEYAFGSKFDRNGDLWVVHCLTGSSTSPTPFRGWALRIKPDGTMVPTCSGIRSPGGVGMNAVGDMFYTDNQGFWNGTSGLKFLEIGGFMGSPAGNNWYERTTALGPRPQDPVSGSRMHLEAAKIPELVPTAVYFPYNKMGQSASGIACDQTEGRFGPFKNQLFVGDQTHSTVMRVFLEKVNGRYQGATFPFLAGFDSGNLTLEFGPDGSLVVGGTDRGWGARGGQPFALQRALWTGRIPFEVLEMRAQEDGFELVFTEPVDPISAKDRKSYSLETYTYIYQGGYGSPEVDGTRPEIQRVNLSPDGRRVRLVVEAVQIGHVHELKLPGLRSTSGKPLLHPIAYYTLNFIPQGVL